MAANSLLWYEDNGGYLMQPDPDPSPWPAICIPPIDSYSPTINALFHIFLPLLSRILPSSQSPSSPAFFHSHPPHGFHLYHDPLLPHAQFLYLIFPTLVLLLLYGKHWKLRLSHRSFPFSSLHSHKDFSLKLLNTSTIDVGISIILLQTSWNNNFLISKL